MVRYKTWNKDQSPYMWYNISEKLLHNIVIYLVAEGNVILKNFQHTFHNQLILIRCTQFGWDDTIFLRLSPSLWHLVFWSPSTISLPNIIFSFGCGHMGSTNFSQSFATPLSCSYQVPSSPQTYPRFYLLCEHILHWNPWGANSLLLLCWMDQSPWWSDTWL